MDKSETGKTPQQRLQVAANCMTFNTAAQGI